jgi:AcrR family transcriptional regulator
MPNTDRSRRFSEIAGEELKVEFAICNFSARAVAEHLGIDATSLHNYTSGKRIIPITIIIDACEVIGGDLVELVKRAYVRLVAELGPP